MFNVVQAYDRIEDVRMLFAEYTTMLGVDLSFQNYDEEFASLPGKYAPPDGRLFLAEVDGMPVGCIALRRFESNRGEMKRLFVRPEYRGQGLGCALVEAVIAAARECGYEALILDTQTRLENSVALYRKLGFRETEPYYANPYIGVVYFTLDL